MTESKHVVPAPSVAPLRKALSQALPLAMGTLIAASLALGPVPSALAVGDRNQQGDGTTGSVTIKNTQGESANRKVAYRALKIFNATVRPTKAVEGKNDPAENPTKNGRKDSQGTELIQSAEVHDVQWPSDEMKTAVESVLKSTWGGQPYQPRDGADTSAQDAAEYIAAHIDDRTEAADGSTASDSGYHLASDELGAALARALRDLQPAKQDLAPDRTYQFEDGYYLIVTQDAIDGAVDNHGTAPIFLAAGGSPVIITQKANHIPSQNPPNETGGKQVKQDADGAKYTTVAADSHMGQEIDYRIPFTLPSNFKTYRTYRVVFHDTLSQGLTPNLETVKVTVKNGENTFSADCRQSGIAVADAGKDATPTGIDGYDGKHELKVTVPDLKRLVAENGEKIAVDEQSVIYLEYRANINRAAVMGGAGNPNEAFVSYSNNPVNDQSMGRTPTTRTVTYAFALHLHKQDKSTNGDLSGARFTLQATAPDDKGSTGRYVQADGTLGADAHEFVTDASGDIEVAGLDAGSYTLHETSAPDGYQPAPDATFAIAPTYQGTSLTQLALEVRGGSDALSGQLAFAGFGDDQDKARQATGGDASVDTAAGIVRLTVEDVKKVDMPFTGQQGITALVLAGTGIVAAALAVLLYRRRRDQGR